MRRLSSFNYPIHVAAAVLILAGLPALAANARAAAIAPQSTTIVFRNINVVRPDTGDVRYSTTVVVKDGVISAVHSQDAGTAGTGATIDGTGKFLMPGLVDAHVHLTRDADLWLPLFVANGVTTIFNMEGAPAHLALREKVAKRELVGPKIYTAGPLAQQPLVNTVEDADRVVREQKAAGYDFIKIYGRLSAEAFAQACKTARGLNLAVVGHAPRNLPFDAVLRNGQVMVAHAEELIHTEFKDLDESKIVPVVRRIEAAKVWITPTLSTFRNFVHQWGNPAAVEEALRSEEAKYLSSSIRGLWTNLNRYVKETSGRDTQRARYEFQRKLVVALARGNVRLLVGTDAPLPLMAPAFSIHKEIAELSEIGLSSRQILAAATSDAGAFIQAHLDRTARQGRVEPGYRADLVVLDRNPLEAIGTLRRPFGVMSDGRWFDREALDQILGKVATDVARHADAYFSESEYTPTPEEISMILGRYVSIPPKTELTLVLEGGTTFILKGKSSSYRLLPVGPFRFRLADAPNETFVVFASDGSRLEIVSEGTVVQRLERAR